MLHAAVVPGSVIGCGSRAPPGDHMTAQIINIWDYRRKEEKPSLEQQAAELAKEFNRMAEEGTEVVCEMDTSPSEYCAPPTDCA
jgi:hypothetical protein